MDELKVLKWCDLCYHSDDVRSEAAQVFTVSIALGKRATTPRTIVVCTKHAAAYQAQMTLIRKVGERIEDAELAAPRGHKPGDQMACPVCGLFFHPASVAAHLVHAHGAKRIIQPTRCPDCHSEYAPSGAMTTHRRRAHGYDNIADMVSKIPKGRKKATA